MSRKARMMIATGSAAALTLVLMAGSSAHADSGLGPDGRTTRPEIAAPDDRDT